MLARISAAVPHLRPAGASRPLLTWAWRKLVASHNAPQPPPVLENHDPHPAVYGWGSGTSSQLGPVCDSQLPATEIALLRHNPVLKLACGADHALALIPYPNPTTPEEVNKQLLFGWGSNFFAQLGLFANSSGGMAQQRITLTSVLTNEGDEHCEPKMLSNFTEEPIIKLSCGFYHSLALTASGKLYLWGTTPYGPGDEEPINKPRLVLDGLGGRGVAVKDCATAGYSSLAVVKGSTSSAGDRAFVWGYLHSKRGFVRSKSPREISGLPSSCQINAVGAGTWHYVLAVQSSSHSHVEEELLVIGKSGLSTKAPTHDSGNDDDDNWTTQHDENTTPSGPLCDDSVPAVKGIGVQLQMKPFYRLKVFGTATIKPTVEKIVGGYEFTVIRLSDGTVQTFGRNDCGQLGRSASSDADATIPLPIPNFPPKIRIAHSDHHSGFVEVDDPVVDIAAGRAHAVAVTKSGRVYAWGSNESMQVKYTSADGDTCPEYKKDPPHFVSPVLAFYKPGLAVAACGAEFTLVGCKSS